MATCEFHTKYADYLTGRMAAELIGKAGQNPKEWSEVCCIVENIAICKILEQITPGETENLTSVVFKLYPQFEEKIRAKLNQQFG